MKICECCKEEFNYTVNLNKHIINNNTCLNYYLSIDKIWKCEVCGKVFTNKILYNQHIHNKEDCAKVYLKDKIENIDYVKCQICGYKALAIGKHLKTEHKINSKEYKKIYNSDVIAKIIHENYKKTCLAKYGVENTSGLTSTIDKRKQTNLERYGTEWAINNENIKSKVENTNLERYGCVSPFGNADVREKTIQTFIQKYGVKNPFELEEVQNKIKQTCLERYGAESPAQSEEIQNKMKQTNLEKYGMAYYTQTEEYKKRQEEIKNKIRDTMKQKYGIYYRSMPRFSLSSQELFASIEAVLLDMYPDLECFYATNREIEVGGKLVTNEYQVLVESVSNNRKVRFLDFYIPALRKWIEFDESYHDSAEQLDDDRVREQEIKAVIPDIELLRIKEEDYLNDKDHTVEKCIDFILS